MKINLEEEKKKIHLHSPDFISGIHPEYSKKYIRRLRISNTNTKYNFDVADVLVNSISKCIKGLDIK